MLRSWKAIKITAAFQQRVVDTPDHAARLSLECIKDIAVYISDTMSMRKQADYWAEKLLKSLEKSRKTAAILKNSEKLL